jgi:antitoxin VapB
MSLSIKNVETCRLARELAAETGETLTEAVTIALRERLQRLRGRKTRKISVEEMLAIGRRVRKHLKGKGADHAELLYDVNGLPK